LFPLEKKLLERRNKEDNCHRGQRKSIGKRSAPPWIKMLSNASSDMTFFVSVLGGRDLFHGRVKKINKYWLLLPSTVSET
jgi:hypothetical protein